MDTSSSDPSTPRVKAGPRAEHSGDTFFKEHWHRKIFSAPAQNTTGVGGERTTASRGYAPRKRTSLTKSSTMGDATAPWRKGRSIITVSEPATGKILGEVGEASKQDVERAAQWAEQAQRRWAQTNPLTRAAVLRRAAALWRENAEEVTSWLVRESGSVPVKADIEVNLAEQICYEAASLPTHPLGEVLVSAEPRWSFSRHRPVGVVSVIAPFNFPLVLAIRSVAPALALGNSVLLKPDPRTAVCGGVSIARVFEEAGLPPGVLHVLPGGAETGEAVVVAPQVRVISFTGSTAAGRKVGETAGKLLKRAHLELGGNNALVVLPGADIRDAASAGAFGSWLHQGQICMTTGRHLVHESLYDNYVAALKHKAENLPVGNPTSAETALGPLIDLTQADHVRNLLARSTAEGARVAAGGAGQGVFIPPTVLTGVTRKTPAWNEEIFGPVAPVMSFSTLEEAAEIINESEYGLSLGILGPVGTAMELADMVDTGKIHINEQTVSDDPTAPFGGTKESGNGSRFGGAQTNIDAFTENQWVTVRSTIAPYPF